jgi:hypothetical protein
MYCIIMPLEVSVCSFYFFLHLRENKQQ